MGYVRNWRGTTDTPNDLSTIYNLTWQPIMVKRSNDDSRNVGVTSELDEDTIIFEIKAKLVELGDSSLKENYVGKYLAIVEDHIRPMVMKGDVWISSDLKSYLVTGFNGDMVKLNEN